MENINFGEIGKCNRCGKPATTYFQKITRKFLSDDYELRMYCQRCLLEKLSDEGLEDTH